MDGFYEWKAGVEGGPVNTKGKLLKQPMFIHRADGEPLAVAGLWTRWRDPDDPEGRYLHSATVITTAANATMVPVHDRMPVILPASRWATWLDPANDDLDVLAPLLVRVRRRRLGDARGVDRRQQRPQQPTRPVRTIR